MLAAVTVVGLAVSACGTGTGDDAGARSASSTVSASASPSSTAVRRPVPGPSMREAAQRLGMATAGLNKSLQPLGLGQKVAVAVLPVGIVADPIVIGDAEPPQVAWSTIKVALAIAAERKHGGPMPATVPAITASDNTAAQSLWDSLGTGAQAAAAVTRVLHDAGDGKTVVPSALRRPPYTVFGQTVWGVGDAARFTAGMACLRDSARVRRLMGRVNGNQQWGATAMRAGAEVKGGWGPGVEGGYVVRQIALITHRDGSQTAVSMVTFGAGTSMASGTAALNHVGAWLERQAENVPRGYCAGA